MSKMFIMTKEATISGGTCSTVRISIRGLAATTQAPPLAGPQNNEINTTYNDIKWHDQYAL